MNGETFTGFKQLNVTRSFDDFSGEARIVVSKQPNNLSFIVIGDLVEIELDGVLVLTGYAEVIGDSESIGTHDISFRVRDKVADIIDSSAPDNVKTLEGVSTIAQLCQLVVDGLGLDINVVDNFGGSIADELKGASVGQNAFDFLNGYARKAQLFLQSNGAADILLQRPEGKLKTLLAFSSRFNRNNIKESSFEDDVTQRFGKYIVRSNGNIADGSTEMDNFGEAIDDEIRESRVLEMVSSEPMTADECTRAAEEERNVRKARGFKYSCTVAGFSANGELWYPGRKVDVRDDEKQINGEFLLREVSWEQSDGGGELTKISVAPPDAYGAFAAPNASQSALTYTVKSGDALFRIARAQGVTLDSIIQANPQIENPNLIRPDQVINIPVTGGDVP